MGSLLGHVLPLAIGAACSPALLAVTVELLAANPLGGRRDAAAYLTGTALPIVVLCLVGVFVAPSVFARGTVGGDRVVDVVDIALGVLLLALGLWLFVHRHTAAKRLHPPSGLGKLVWLGVATMVTNVSTLLMVIAGLREVVDADVGAAGELVATVVLVVGATAPVLVPLGIDLVAPGPSRRLLDRAQSLLARHGTAIGIVVSGFFGVYLIGRGARAW